MQKHLTTQDPIHLHEHNFFGMQLADGGESKRSQWKPDENRYENWSWNCSILINSHPYSHFTQENLYIVEFMVSSMTAMSHIHIFALCKNITLHSKLLLNFKKQAFWSIFVLPTLLMRVNQSSLEAMALYNHHTVWIQSAKLPQPNVRKVRKHVNFQVSKCGKTEACTSKARNV